MSGFRPVRNSDLVAWAGEAGVRRLSAAVVDLWKVSAETRRVLVDVGLPRFHPQFVPDPQDRPDPLVGSLYVIGREEAHDHSDSGRFVPCGCGYFGIDRQTSEVWQAFPDDPDESLMVNSSLAQFVYFLDKLGAAKKRYEELPDTEMIQRYERVMSRLKKWDPSALDHPASFWQTTFGRAWG